MWTLTFAWTIQSFAILDAIRPNLSLSTYPPDLCKLFLMYRETIPLLSTPFAHLLAGVFVFTYVGSIYASKSARLRFSKRKVNLPEGQARLKLQSERWRDDPDVIKARLIAVTSATLICCLIVFMVMKNGNGDNATVSDHLLWWRACVVHV